MKTLNFVIVDQSLKRTDKQKVIGDCIGQYQAIFTFNNYWNGYVPTAQFTKNGCPYDAPIINNKCVIPPEALIGTGEMHVHVVGNDPDGNRITVNDLVVLVEPSGWKSKSSISTGPVVTIWNQIVELLETVSKDGFYKIPIADMKAKNIYTVEKGIVETIEEDALYAVNYTTSIIVGSWNKQTGVLTSNFNTDFGIDKQFVSGIWFPTINAGDGTVWYDSGGSVGFMRSLNDLAAWGEIMFDVHTDVPSIIIDISGAGDNPNATLYIRQKIYFQSDPTTWGWEEMREYLAGDEQGAGGFAANIGLKICVPKTISVSVAAEEE